jgi:hypothetical protein
VTVSRRGFLKGIGAAVGLVAAAKYLPDIIPPAKEPEAFRLNYVIKAAPGEVPPGTVVAYGKDFPPDGWLLCDGQSVPKAQYRGLYNAIGDTYDSTPLTFRVPDLRGHRVLLPV